MTTAPKWAQDLTLNTLLYLQSRGYKPEVPILNWRHGTQKFSSGRCFKDRVVVTAGKDRTDARMVLLHELAHWARPFGEHHTDKFWDLAWELYRWAKLPIRYCKTREQQYRIGSLAAYRRSTPIKRLAKGG